MVSVDIGNGANNYLTPRQARLIAKALKTAADDVDAVPFTVSTIPTWNMQEGG